MHPRPALNDAGLSPCYQAHPPRSFPASGRGGTYAERRLYPRHHSIAVFNVVSVIHGNFSPSRLPVLQRPAELAGRLVYLYAVPESNRPTTLVALPFRAPGLFPVSSAGATAAALWVLTLPLRYTVAGFAPAHCVPCRAVSPLDYTAYYFFTSRDAAQVSQIRYASA